METPVHFEGMRGRYFYAVMGQRCPLKGEFYLSGAIVQAWKAPNDFSSTYTVVKPTHKARQAWVRGERV